MGGQFPAAHCGRRAARPPGRPAGGALGPHGAALGRSGARLVRFMDAAQEIRDAVALVERLRDAAQQQPTVAASISAVKRFQSRRFEHSYQDLLGGGPYKEAAAFFLDELYGDTNYARRDAQFSRVAGAIQKLLPKSAVDTALALAQLHALTEQLDYAMGQAWERDLTVAALDDPDRYIRAWRATGRPNERSRQLKLVLDIGEDLDALTRAPGLRLMLKMMHGPAQAVGLAELQRFLEQGFDTFAAMGKNKGGARGFLELVETREARLIALLFDARYEQCRAALADVVPSKPQAAP